jgi:hypothetical protein
LPTLWDRVVVGHTTTTRFTALKNNGLWTRRAKEVDTNSTEQNSNCTVLALCCIMLTGPVKFLTKCLTRLGGVSEPKSQATHAFIPALVIRPGHNLMGGRNLLGGYAIGVLSYRITTLGTSDDLLDRMSKVRGLLYLLWPLTYLPRHDAQKTEKQW